MPPISPHTLVWMRQPTMKPTMTINDHDEHVAHEVGERAARQHGGTRHRQRLEPLDQTLCAGPRPSATPVWIEPNTTVCANTPGIR